MMITSCKACQGYGIEDVSLYGQLVRQFGSEVFLVGSD